MDTEKDSTPQPKGKTVFHKYSTWRNGQHMTTVLQMVPGQEKKVVIGKIYFERNGEEKTYVAKSADGKKILGVSKSYVDIEKRFAEHGDNLAKREMEKEVPIPQEPVSNPEQTLGMPTPKTPAEEIAKVRERSVKSNDQSKAR
jgi:hypothetical protein